MTENKRKIEKAAPNNEVACCIINKCTRFIVRACIEFNQFHFTFFTPFSIYNPLSGVLDIRLPLMS